MPTMKASQAPDTAARAKRFSLVPASAQKEMYKALETLERSKITVNGAETAEIAFCSALGTDDPVVLTSTAAGARTLNKGKQTESDKLTGTKCGSVGLATVSAISELLGNATATALICAGKLETSREAQKDYRSAFAFASRHKLPILFLVANTLTVGHVQRIDIRTLHAELGIPVFSVAANDAIAAYRVATEALHNTRHSRGPCVIEALTVNAQNGSHESALNLLRDYMVRHGNWPV